MGWRMKMGDVNHHRIKTNGIWMHVAEKGDEQGPLVLLLHGFPEIWFSWRHQINHLASHGYHVLAPDLRGYGDSDSPLSPTSYTIFHIVADLLGLLDHFNHQQGFDPVHLIASYLDEFHPNMHPKRLITTFYVNSKSHWNPTLKGNLTVMKKILFFDKLVSPPGMEFIDCLETPSVLPPWITEEELQVYADKFQESGFTGGLNYYRAMDLNWELQAPWQGSKVTVPSKLIIGDKDIELGGTKEYVNGDVLKGLVPGIEVVILEGHHFIQQENPKEVSDHIISFLNKLAAN